MSFLAMIVALILAQAWGSGNRVQHDEWFDSLVTRVRGWTLPGEVGLALLVLVPAVVAQLALNLLEPILFGLPWIGLAAFLLLYSMGRRDFHALLERYRQQCENEDFEGAYLTTLSELGWTTTGDDPVSPPEVHRLVQRGFFYEGYQRWFAVLFYFVLLGPAGALAYRLLQLSRHSFEPELVEKCLFVVDWVPARVLAAAFALTGDFVGSRDDLMESAVDGSLGAAHLLQRVGRAALDMDDEAPPAEVGFGLFAARQNTELASLLSRSAACWVAVISLLVLLV
jgi:AmpE protein